MSLSPPKSWELFVLRAGDGKILEFAQEIEKVLWRLDHDGVRNTIRGFSQKVGAT